VLTPTDKEIRRYRITASTLSGFIGLNPFSSPSLTWDYHTERIPFPENDNTKLGQLLEPGLIAFGAYKLQWDEYLYPCGTRISKEHPWACATPDALKPDGSTGIQAKNQNFYMKNGYLGKPSPETAADNDLLPPYMNLQCQWEMMVLGSNRWHLSTYFGGNDFRIYKVWRDQPMIDRLIPIAFEFWKNHIDPDGPCTRPSDEHWNPNAGKVKPRKKTRAEILAAPVQSTG